MPGALRYPHTRTVASLAAGATETLTVESVDHLADIGTCNLLIVKNESGQDCEVLINGDTQKNLKLPTGKTEAWDREFEFSSVVVKNVGSGAQNATGVFVTIAYLKPFAEAPAYAAPERRY